MTLVTIESFYFVVGLILLLIALKIVTDDQHPKRWGSGLFWGLLAIIFMLGRVLPSLIVGYMVLIMVALAVAKQVGRSAAQMSSREERTASAERLGNGLFWPALLIPVVAVFGSLVLSRIQFGPFRLLEAKNATIISVGLGALFALGAALKATGAPRGAPITEGSRLLQTIGWALILPQMLAALGGIFAQAGVGTVVADLVGRALPTQYPLVAVIAYCLGMALFTMCMGNAFAAFAVITGGIGLPLIVQQHHGNPAIMAAIGMLSGYCGTLMTPMAANFNLVPAMLLELKDKNAVIKAQVPIGLSVLAANIVIMYLCVYRF